MGYSVKLADLRNMAPAAREAALSELVNNAKAPRNGQGAVLDAKIKALEGRYEMTSDELVAKLRDGRFRETAEVSRWLFWLEARSAHAG